MPDIQKLPLESALEDTPETRLLVGVFEQDTKDLVKYMKGLWKCCQRLIVAQQEVTVSIRSLANHLRSYPQQSPLETDSDTAPTIREFAQNIEEIGSWHHGLCTQLAESVAAPVHRYIDKELQEVFTVGQMYQTVTDDLDRTLCRYARLSKRSRPDLEAERTGAASEVYTTRKKFHQMSLLYYNKMNLLQYSRKMALVDPLLGFIQAYRSFFSMGNGSLNVPEMETFLSTVTAASAATQSELMTEMAESADLMDAIITQSEGQYSVEPADVTPPGHADEPPTNIADYLFYKTRYMGVMAQWERVFVFTEGGNLLLCRRGEAAGCLLTELDPSTICQPLNNDDRPAVFQISTSKKSVILQAMNDRQRDEWIAAITNIVKTGGYVRRPAGPGKAGSPSAGSILSGVSQFFADKLQSHSGDGSRTRGADTPDSLSADAPIVFELPWSPDEEPPADGDAPPFSGQTFAAGYLGSMEVQADRGHRLVSEVIRQIEAARQQHRLADAARCRLVVGLNDLRVTEPGEQGRLRALYPFHHISFWAPHLENDRLLGLITLTPGQAFFCHVFETEAAGQQLCSALTHATTAAYRRHKEADLLLQNVRRSDEPQLTADGAALLLSPGGPEETAPPPQQQPPTDDPGPGQTPEPAIQQGPKPPESDA